MGKEDRAGIAPCGEDGKPEEDVRRMDGDLGGVIVVIPCIVVKEILLANVGVGDCVAALRELVLGVLRTIGGRSSFGLGDRVFPASSGSAERGKTGEEGGRAVCVALFIESRFISSGSDRLSLFVDSGGSG